MHHQKSQLIRLAESRLECALNGHRTGVKISGRVHCDCPHEIRSMLPFATHCCPIHDSAPTTGFQSTTSWFAEYYPARYREVASKNEPHFHIRKRSQIHFSRSLDIVLGIITRCTALNLVVCVWLLVISSRLAANFGSICSVKLSCSIEILVSRRDVRGNDLADCVKERSKKF